MPLSRFRGANREDNGFIGPPLIDESFDMPDQSSALNAAHQSASDVRDPAVNAFWLTDSEGHLIWSLRGPDRQQTE